MIIGKWRFAPGLLPTIATLLFLPVLVSLAVWQLDRAQQKTDRHEAYTQGLESSVIDLNQAGSLRQDAVAMDWHTVSADGTFKNDMQLLFDNRVVNGQVGYYVYTPFRLAEHDLYVLINRGWVSAGASRSDIPKLDSVSERVIISGIAKQPQSAGIKLDGTIAEEISKGIFRVQSIDLDEISRLTKLPLLPYVIRMESDAAYGYVRNWAKPGDGSVKHMGYAFQWFAMAAGLLVLFFVVNIKKVET